MLSHELPLPCMKGGLLHPPHRDPLPPDPLQQAVYDHDHSSVLSIVILPSANFPLQTISCNVHNSTSYFSYIWLKKKRTNYKLNEDIFNFVTCTDEGFIKNKVFTVYNSISISIWIIYRDFNIFIEDHPFLSYCS